MSVINLTPHAITFIHEDQSETILQSQGVARAASSTEYVGQLEGFRLTRTTFGEPVNLPDYSEGTYYVVSVATANAARAYGRRVDDLLLTNEAVRNADGSIRGCKSFAIVG